MGNVVQADPKMNPAVTRPSKNVTDTDMFNLKE
jgi:hypothetical protein